VKTSDPKFLITVAYKNIEYDIYRKLTATNVTKMVIRSTHATRKLIHRALSVPLYKENFENEINTVKLIANRNNVKIDIDKVVKKTERKNTRSQICPPSMVVMIIKLT
jgi:hypothetical protein